MLLESNIMWLADAMHGDVLLAKHTQEMARISTDSRRIEKDDLYLALVGERFDGHDFVRQAIEQQVSGVVVERRWADSDTGRDVLFSGSGDKPKVHVFVVEDTFMALSDLAQAQRDVFDGRVVAITGSAGKTTTKQLAHAILSMRWQTGFTQGNLNNHIGVPLTLLDLTIDDQAAVIELGASGEGEIDETARLVKPNVAIITNASEAHLSGFGSLDTIVRTKGELLAHIQKDGVAILNADDSALSVWQNMLPKELGIHTICVGMNDHADMRATDCTYDAHGCSFTLHYQQQTQRVRLPLLGKHNVMNALLAAAAGVALGLALEDVAEGLAHVEQAHGRLEYLTGTQGQQILDDSYNASPASVMAAIDVLSEHASSWLVFGDMGELGDATQRWHERIGHYAKEKGIAHVMTVGEHSAHTARVFGDGAQHFSSKQTLLSYLDEHTKQGDIILIKGSRGAAMNDVVAALTKQEVA